MNQLHSHEWSIRLDANDRRYAVCRTCQEVVHEWEPEFHSIYIKAPSFEKGRWETKKPNA